MSSAFFFSFSFLLSSSDSLEPATDGDAIWACYQAFIKRKENPKLNRLSPPFAVQFGPKAIEFHMLKYYSNTFLLDGFGLVKEILLFIQKNDVKIKD